MPPEPPAQPTRIIIIAKPPRKRSQAVQAAVARPVRIVYAPRLKQKDAWRRYLALTGRDE